jgi:hypothetical protein
MWEELQMNKSVTGIPAVHTTVSRLMRAHATEDPTTPLSPAEQVCGFQRNVDCVDFLTFSIPSSLNRSSVLWIMRWIRRCCAACSLGGLRGCKHIGLIMKRFSICSKEEGK